MRLNEMAVNTRIRRILLGGLLLGLSGSGQAAPRAAQEPAAAAPSGEKDKSQPAIVPEAPLRGTKLSLKDGCVHLVRSYERKGDRVRYYSLERHAWEELPAELVDWEATARTEEERNKEDKSLLQKVHREEEASQVEIALDIDASLQVAPGVFLPPGEGMFAVAGKAVTALEQVGTQVRTDKGQLLKQVLVPIPIVPSKHNLEIPGVRAKQRFAHGQLEFYLREAPPDSEKPSGVRKSSRPGESGPEVELIQASVKGDKRRVESLRSFFGQEMEATRTTISLQRWQIAPNVFRFTLSQNLAPGEYVLAEILPEGMNLYVWDFGVD
ncbi:MAG: hypothetical protein LAN71_14670 [Acidobacteriia bacterium]|nr:hypothetical protein [Terriglobia bacterium]